MHNGIKLIVKYLVRIAGSRSHMLRFIGMVYMYNYRTDECFKGILTAYVRNGFTYTCPNESCHFCEQRSNIEQTASKIPKEELWNYVSALHAPCYNCKFGIAEEHTIFKHQKRMCDITKCMAKETACHAHEKDKLVLIDTRGVSSVTNAFLTLEDVSPDHINYNFYKTFLKPFKDDLVAALHLMRFDSGVSVQLNDIVVAEEVMRKRIDFERYEFMRMTFQNGFTNAHLNEPRKNIRRDKKALKEEISKKETELKRLETPLEIGLGFKVYDYEAAAKKRAYLENCKWYLQNL